MKIIDLLENKHPSFFELKKTQDKPYYHGSTTRLGIRDRLLPPAMTGELAEIGRQKNLDKIFFTEDYKSAVIYGRKAVKKWGGELVIFRVYPVGKVEVLNDAPGTTVYMADWAYVEPVT